MKTLIVIALMSGACAVAGEPKPDAPQDAAAAAVSKIFAPTALEEMKPLKGQKIIVEGKVLATGENKTGTIRYLNYTQNFRDSVSLVFFANMGGGTFTKEKLAEYVNKTVRVNGVLSEYNGALQIKIESLDQLKIQPDPEPAPAQ